MRIKGDVYWYKEQGFFDANTYVIKDELTVLIDPGLENYLRRRLKEISADGTYLKDIDIILVTHLHPDHCGAVAALKELSGAQVALHPSQRGYLDIMTEEVVKFFGFDISRKFSADLVLGERLSLGKTYLKVLHTPGHSPCSVCFYAGDRKMLICGDLIFEEGVGRTDLPFGNTEELKNSIEMLSTLDTNLLLPGHGGIMEGRNRIKRNYELVSRKYLHA